MPRGVYNPAAPSRPSLRRYVIARDGLSCQQCGTTTHQQRHCPNGRHGCPSCHTVTHRRRPSQGGPTHLGNLHTACRACAYAARSNLPAAAHTTAASIDPHTAAILEGRATPPPRTTSSRRR